MSTSKKWRVVSADEPCPVCLSPAAGCAVAADGRAAVCKTVKSERSGKRGGWVHELQDGKPVTEKPPSQAERLARLAHELYRIGLAAGDEPFAVPHGGPNVALMFRGSRDALRSALAREYRRRYNTTPNASALADALTALQGEAHECAPEPVSLRIAEHDGGIVLDLGDADGRAVVIQAGGWHVADKSPVLFRRTALTGALPEPQSGGDVELLRALVNVKDASWPLVLGWLVAALLPSLPHPVLLLGGEQGTGKSTAARYLFGLFDPSPALLRSPPESPRQWAISAAGSWGVAIDNVSTIWAWWSDALCKAVTGDGWVDRRLYTDSELAVLSFRRVILLTSIDAGALRGDLGDRLLIVDLDRIPEESRRPESELDGLYAERLPQILGALLNLVAAVLARLPHVKLSAMPRMADFARVLAAMDGAIGTDALLRYLAQGGRIASDVIQSDPVGVALVTLVESTIQWEGTVSELFDRIEPDKPAPHGWPKSPPALGTRLKRLTPALRKVGIEVEQTRGSDRTRTRRVSLRMMADSPVRSVRPSGDSEPESTEALGDVVDGDPRRTASDGSGRGRRIGRPHTGGIADDTGHSDASRFTTADDSDGSDGVFPANSDEVVEWTG